MRSGTGENLLLKHKIIDWMANNEPTIYTICQPLLEDKKNLFDTTPSEYHEDIVKQYKDMVLTRVCDAVCRDLGCSAEDFYETIEGTEDKWISLTLD
jgi:hypothetical protein